MGSVSIPVERICCEMFLIAEENAHLSAHGALLHVDEDFILAYAFLGVEAFNPLRKDFYPSGFDIDLPRILHKNQLQSTSSWNNP